MKCNVLSFHAAKHKDLDTGLYAFKAMDVPIGTVSAVLDFKLWAKKIMAVNCYFTELVTGRKFTLTVYYETYGYRLGAAGIDFSTCPTGVVYVIAIQCREGKTKFIRAEVQE